MKRLLIPGLFALGISMTANAGVLNILNPGFDIDVLPDGSFNCNGTIGFSNWMSPGGGCGTGLLNPNITQTVGGLAPSGNNVVYENGPNGYYQVLSDTYQVGMTYNFGLMIGSRLDAPPDRGYTLEFRWDTGSGFGAPVASITGIGTAGAGLFAPSTTLSYTVGAGDAAIGKNVIVMFKGGTLPGIQTLFDSAVGTTTTPEPGTLALVAVSGGLLALGRRKRAV